MSSFREQPPSLDVRAEPALERGVGADDPPPIPFGRAPSELALRRLEQHNARAGHENAGFLSVARGFLPALAPLTQLGAAFAAWDELAHDLPALYHTLELRRRVEALPVLDASPDSLPARELLRACALLAISAHAYWYVDTRPPRALPEALQRPWAQVRARLGRRQEVLSYVDLVVYNWKQRDPAHPDPFAVENLELLLPTVGNAAERVFYLTQLEILARTSPVVRLAAVAQGAVVREDDEELEAALVGIIDCLARVVGTTLPKINPNPYARTYVDPVLWATTVAPLAVPIHRGDQGPSGTSSPLFNTLDSFFGRKDYASFLGREMQQLRASYPHAWQVFIRSLSEVSVARFVEQRGKSSLRSAFREAFELYAGETGFLGRHRIKVYGYLELAFKVGRSVTIGGFGGAFTDRTWDQVDRELERAQSERTDRHPPPIHRARVLRTDATSSALGSGIRNITLDVSRAGIRYRGGDRCLILPENELGLVERTLGALGASGDELVTLTPEWRSYARERAELAGKSQVSARELLRYGAIRPVSPRLAEALHARTQSAFLLDAIERGVTERWELWELLDLLRARGHEPLQLWQGDRESLSRLIPPQRFRVYSVSSAPCSPLRRAERSLQLTVGQLEYRAAEPSIHGSPAPRPVRNAPAPPSGCPMHGGEARSGPSADRACSAALRYGTGSGFLSRALGEEREVPFRIQRPGLFRLPDDPDVPIVMFAGGSGVAPFRAFLFERQRTSRGTCHLFLSLRSPRDFLYADDFATAVASGALTLEVTFTREGGSVALGEPGRLAVRPGPMQRIRERMLEPRVREALWRMAQPKEAGGEGAVFYVCGRSGFAETVLTTLTEIFRAQLGDARAAALMLYRLVGDRRLLQELHGDCGPLEPAQRSFDLSEVAQRNDAAHGYWIVVDRVVYDVSEFIELHPGGRRVIQMYAGMDASHGFSRAHQGRADVDAMRERYRIGMLRTPRFDAHAVEVQAANGPLTVDAAVAYRTFTKALSLAVEMQNALRADQSLQEGALQDDAAHGSRSPYQLLRAVETHRRFLAHYLAPWVTEVLPELWCIAQGLFFADARADFMRAFLHAERASSAAEQTYALALDALESFERFQSRGVLADLVALFEARDQWFLRALKHALSLAVRAFEAHGEHVRMRGATRIRRACLRMAAIVRKYHRRAARETAQLVHANALATAAALAQGQGSVTRRLHTGAHWILEEDAAQRTVLLRRMPVAVHSLSALAQENEQVLRCLRPRHTAYGLVVDTRHARMRNDSGFEDAMAKLRNELTGHFSRTAVLLESSIGELQVTRLGRDERADVIATRSESAAFKFAQGGA